MSGAEAFPPLRGHGALVSSLAFSPDGTHIVSGLYDNTVCVWDTVSGAKAFPPLRGHKSSVYSVAFSSDGTRIVSKSGKQVLIWDTATGCPYLQSGGTYDEQFDPLHDLVAISLKPRSGWITSTNRAISKLSAMIEPMCRATSGKSLVIGTKGGQVIILNFPQAMLSSPDTHIAKVKDSD
jgi:WD40 repeat protein